MKISSHFLKLTLLIALSLLLFSPACKSLKEVGKGGKATATLNKTKANNLIFSTLRINGRGKAQVPGQDFSLGIAYKIEVEAAQKIRIRVTKMGLEGARILITRDSVFVLDRLNKRAYCSDLRLAKDFIGFDASFDLIQAMLIGDFYPIPLDLERQVEKKNPLTYKGTTAGTDFFYQISTDLLKMVGMEAKNAEQNMHTKLTYSEFTDEAGQKFASEGEVNVYSPQAAGFSFKHNKVEIDPNNISFAFKIPDNYEIVAN